MNAFIKPSTEKDRPVINVDVLVIPCSRFLCVWHFITLQILEQQLQVERKVKVEWCPLYGPKLLFEFGEKRPIVCYCTHEQKMNFEDFTQNGCYSNQPQPFEVVFYRTDANTYCSFTKQDLTVKQAHRASFCFVLWFELTFWQLTLVSSAVYRPLLEITSFHTTPIGQIIPCHVTEVEMFQFFGLYHHNSISL